MINDVLVKPLDGITPGSDTPAAIRSRPGGAAVCFPNRDEAVVLVGEADPVTMATRLTRHYGVVALKLGGAGCVLAVPGEDPVHVAAVRVHPVRDTTGAGDAFCGAFMSRWLTGGPDPHAANLVGAAEFAARIAASVVTRFGARPSVSS